MESILSDGTLEFDDDAGDPGDPGRAFPIRVRLPAGAPQVGDRAGDTGPGALRLPCPPTPPEPPAPSFPSSPPAPLPELLPWPKLPTCRAHSCTLIAI